MDTDTLGDDLLGRTVEGHNLSPTTLGDLLDERTTLLVFLRHYG